MKEYMDRNNLIETHNTKWRLRRRLRARTFPVVVHEAKAIKSWHANAGLLFYNPRIYPALTFLSYHRLRVRRIAIEAYGQQASS